MTAQIRESETVASGHRAPWSGAVHSAFLGILSTVAGVYLFLAGKGTTFFFDEWEFLITRNHGLGEEVFRTHVGHPSLVPLAIYRVLFALAGLERYSPYRMTLIGLHILVCTLLFVYARRRVHAIVALSMATMLLFFGSAWNDLIWAFQIGYLGSLAGVLGALLFLDRRDRWGDRGASVCLLVAVMSSGLGLPGVAAVMVHVALSPGRLRRAWIVAPAIVAYGIIVLGFSDEPSQLKLANLDVVPGFLASASTSVLRAGFGGGIVVASVVVVTGIALAARRALLDAEARPQLATLAVLPLAFWGVTAVARGTESPGASRYLYPGALFLLLLAAEVAGRTPPIAPPRWLTVALVTLTGISVAVNVAPLREGRRFLIPISVKLRAELAALEIARPAGVDPAFRPEPIWAPDIVAGPYFEMIDRLGSPTYGEATLVTRPPQERYDADRVLVGAEILRVVPTEAAHTPPGPAPAPPIDHLYSGSLVQDGSCFSLAGLGGVFVTVTVPPGGVTVTAANSPVVVYVRRFGDVFVTEPLSTISSGASVRLLPAPDASKAPWHLQLKTTDSLRACTAGTH